MEVRIENIYIYSQTKWILTEAAAVIATIELGTVAPY